MDIVAYLRLLRRHWKLIVACTVIGGLAGAASTLVTQDPRDRGTFFKATHTLFLDTSEIGDALRPVYTNLDQIAVLVTAGDVPRRVAGQLGGHPEDWTERVFTVTNGTTNTLDITCAARSEEEATTCADTFATELIASLTERETTRFSAELDEAVKRLDSLQARLADLDAQIAARPPNADVLNAQRQSLFNQYRLAYERFQGLADQGGPATIVSTLEPAEAQPISRSEYETRLTRGRLGENRIRADSVSDESEAIVTSSDENQFSSPTSRGVLGALLGMLVGIGLAVVADRVDRRLRTREEVEAVYRMAVLAEVPALAPPQQRSATLLSASAPLSRTAEAYRAVRSSLLFQRAGEPPRDGEGLVVLVTSAGPKEGKTTTAANLAAVFAETGSRVLVVNCDFRRPTLHRYFGVPNEPRRVLSTDLAGVWVVTDFTAGTHGTNPATVVEEQRRVVGMARWRFDVVILDTAPLLTTNDATEIMDSADVAVVVCRSGVTTIDGATRARELLARIAAPVSGVVLLGSEATPNDYYHYYSRGRAKQIARERELALHAPAPPDTTPSTEAFFDPGGAPDSAPAPSPPER